MYNVSKMERTLAIFLINGSKYFKRPSTRIPFHYFMTIQYLSSYYRSSFRGYFVNFQCQAKLLDWFFAKLVIVHWQNHCRNNRHSLSFFALLIWWLVGSAGLLVGHPFDTLKVSTPPIYKLLCPKNGGLLMSQWK